MNRLSLRSLRSRTCRSVIVGVLAIAIAFLLALGTSAAPSAALATSSSVPVVAHDSPTTTYSCPSGGTLDGATCEVTTTTPATPMSPTYTCNAGDTLSGETCTKTTSTPAIAGADAYTCNAGDSLSGETCTKTTTTAATETVTGETPEYAYECSSGTLSGDDCDSSYAATLTGTGDTPYTCPSGWTVDGANCERTFSSTEAACSADDGSYSGGECTTLTAASGGQPEYAWECPDGGTLDANYDCDVSTPASEEEVGETPTYGYTCSSGTLSGDECTSTSTYAATESPTYSCTTGTLSGDLCQTESTYAATLGPSYSCSTGTLSGAVCDVESTYAATSSLSCPSGEELDGTNCIDPSAPSGPTGPTNPSGPTGPSITTYTATAIATAGKVFTATSIVSQAAAQATANAEATAYDAANPTKISKSQTTTVTGASTPTSHPVISTTVTVTNAPDKAKGVVTATLVGPIAKTASGCRATPASAFTKAKRTLYTKAVVGSGTFKVEASAPSAAGCYAWAYTITYTGGAKVTTVASGKSSVIVK